MLKLIQIRKTYEICYQWMYFINTFRIIIWRMRKCPKCPNTDLQNWKLLFLRRHTHTQVLFPAPLLLDHHSPRNFQRCKICVWELLRKCWITNHPALPLKINILTWWNETQHLEPANTLKHSRETFQWKYSNSSDWRASECLQHKLVL